MIHYKKELSSLNFKYLTIIHNIPLIPIVFEFYFWRQYLRHISKQTTSLLVALSLLFLLHGNLAYSQRALRKSIYFTNPSKKAIVMPNSVKTSPYRLDPSLIADPARRERIESRISQAETQIKEGMYIEALDTIEAIEGEIPNNYKIYFLKALAFQNIGDSVYANENYRRAIDFSPPDPLLYKNAASFYNILGQYEESIKTYIKAYKILKEDGWINYAGNLALENNDLQSANYYYNLLIKEKKKAYSYEGIGNIEFRVGNYKMAFDIYSEAFKEYKRRNKEYTNTMLFTDNILRIQALMEKAKVYENISLWRERFLTKDFNNALLILRELSEYSSKYPELMLYTAKTHFEMGDFDDAKNILPYVIQSAPELEEAYILLAQMDVYDGNYNSAINQLEKGFNSAYDKPELYEVLVNILYSSDNIYYANQVVEQIGRVYELSPDNRVRYANSLITKKEYDDAQAILESISPPIYAANMALRNIEYRKILDKSLELYENRYYFDIMKLLSRYKFAGIEEEIRIRYLANAYQMLGSIDKAIDVLYQKFKAQDIGINNLLFLRHLLETRRDRPETTQDQKNTDLVTIKATVFLEENLNNDLEYIRRHVMEFIEYSQFQNALTYMENIKKSGFAYDQVIKLEAMVYTYYAVYLYETGNLDLARGAADLAVSRDFNNYDSIVIKRDIEIALLLESLGDFTDSDVNVILSPTIRRVIDINPAYLSNRILLASLLAREYNLEGFEIAKKLRDIANIPGQYYGIMGEVYFKARLYPYANNTYAKALKNSKSKDIRLGAATVKYTMGLSKEGIDILKKLSKEYPEDYNILYHLARAYTKEESNFENSGDIIVKLLERDPQNPHYLYLYAYLQELLGSEETAISAYTSIARSYRNYAAAYYKSASLALKYYDDAKIAEPYALLYRALTPKSYQSHALLGAIYLDQAENEKDISTAGLLFEQALNSYSYALSFSYYGRDRSKRKELADIVQAISLRISESTITGK